MNPYDRRFSVQPLHRVGSSASVNEMRRASSPGGPTLSRRQSPAATFTTTAPSSSSATAAAANIASNTTNSNIYAEAQVQQQQQQQTELQPQQQLLQPPILLQNNTGYSTSIAPTEIVQGYTLSQAQRRPSIVLQERNRILGDIPLSITRRGSYLRRNSVAPLQVEQVSDSDLSTTDESNDANSNPSHEIDINNDHPDIEMQDNPEPLAASTNSPPIVVDQAEVPESSNIDQEEKRIEDLKDIVVSDLDAHDVPLAGNFSLSSQKIVLPSELDALKEYAITNKVAARDKKIKSLKNRMKAMRERATVSYSQSMDDLSTKRRSFKSYLKKMLFVGPFWKPVKKTQTKVYDVRKEDLTDVQSTIIDLGYALSIYGVPAHRLEYHLALVASFYGLNCTSYSTPTGLWIMFGHYVDDPDANTHFVRITSSSLNLSKLCLLDDVADKISKGSLTIKDARMKIKEIIAMKPMYSNFLFTIVSCIIQAGGFSIFFNANWGEIVASFVAGLFVGIVSVLGDKIEAISQVTTILCAVVAGIVGIIFKLAFAKVIAVSAFIVSLSGVVSLLPGLTFTLSIAEISTRNMLSGATRLISAFVTTVQIGFGVLVSSNLSKFLQNRFTFLPEVSERDSYAIWILAILIAPILLATMISFRAPRYPVAFFFIVLDAYAGFFATYYVTAYFGSQVGACLGAFVVGFIANIYGAISRHPSIVVSACGIIYLVPGSISYRSVNAFLNSDAAAGVSFLFDTVITAVSLTVGLLLADIFAFKRKKLSL